MSRIALATTTLLLFMLDATALRALGLASPLTAPTALTLAAQDDLPDGDLDFNAEDLNALDKTDKPADKKPANKKPADKKPADKKPADKKPADNKAADHGAASQPGAVPDLEPIKSDDEIVAPPDERDGEAGQPGEPTSDAKAGSWTDDSAGSSGKRPQVVDEDPEAEERARLRRAATKKDDEALTSKPLFWVGVGGGALLAVGAAVGGGFLIYYLLNANNGSVKVVLQ